MELLFKLKGLCKPNFVVTVPDTLCVDHSSTGSNRDALVYTNWGFCPLCVFSEVECLGYILWLYMISQ